MTFSTGTVSDARYLADMSDAEFWGTAFPSWIAALATVAAVVAAVWAGKTAKRLYDQEVDRDQRVIDNAERAQADRVAAWMAHSNDPLVPGTEGTGFGMVKRGWVCRLRNASDVPVYNVDVRIEAPGGQERGRIERSTLPPTSTHFDADLPDMSHAISGTENNYRLLLARISFTDAAGRRWTRSGTGILTASDR